MFKDKTIDERMAILQNQYSAGLEQLQKASDMKKQAKKFLMILKNQMEVLKDIPNA